jgi:hypothetical protein
METNEVSLHQFKVYDVVRRNGKWVTAKEITDSLDDVAYRTVRAHTRKLVQLGILDVAEVFPAHRYRMSEFAERRNKAYLQRLERAREVFA